MKNISLIFFLSLGIFSCKTQDKINLKTNSTTIKNMENKIEYPHTRMGDVVENYHGNNLPDPFRWLEDDNSEETVNWVKSQNITTNIFLDRIPFVEKITKRLQQLWDYEKYGSPFKEGDMYYYFKNNGLQNQYVLYGSKAIKEEGVVVLDPNKFSDDGTASLGGMSFNSDGTKLAYMISEGGSDWRTIYVKDIITGELLIDKVNWVKFSGVSWKGDGFYYSRYPEPKEGDELSSANSFHALYYHKLGEDQSKDKLIFVDKDHPQRNVYGGTTDDERFLIISTSESTSGNAFSIIDLNKNPDKIKVIEDAFDNDFSLIDNNDGKLYILTNKDAPKQKLISIDVNNSEESNWKTIIPESEDPLSSVSIVGGKIFASYMHNASSLVKIYTLEGQYVSNLKLPGIGSGGSVRGKKNDKIGFYSFTSFTRPSTIYSLNMETLESEVFRQPTVDFDSDAYETNQIWYKSKDGTEIPMFVTKKKTVKLNGNNPTLLYGYGGFNISITPSFSLTRLPFLENGGIYVVANIRGGGEFGKEWHKAGTLENKQNVFDDFIAAAEYLITNKYTNSKKLAIEGGSNGGLLVGACMTQRPELFAVAFPRVGVLDMLRYDKFTIGWAWATDYGKSEDPKAFDYLIKYSPLHNVNNVAYPATMVMTADHDDRVVPAHSFKFIAELQKKHTGKTPVLIRIETAAGHGAGKPTSKVIEEAADALGFLLFNMNEEFK
ncbi:MAG: prolyl oligopeptidase family serine peptidase [Saprospiraceae bacterium]